MVFRQVSFPPPVSMYPSHTFRSRPSTVSIPLYPFPLPSQYLSIPSPSRLNISLSLSPPVSMSHYPFPLLSTCISSLSYIYIYISLPFPKSIPFYPSPPCLLCLYTFYAFVHLYPFPLLSVYLSIHFLYSLYAYISLSPPASHTSLYHIETKEVRKRAQEV